MREQLVLLPHVFYETRNSYSRCTAGDIPDSIFLAFYDRDCDSVDSCGGPGSVYADVGLARKYDCAGVLPVSGKSHFDRFAVFPYKIYCRTSAHLESLEASVLPFLWQGREHVDESFMTLEQHFSYAGCPSEVSVNLEWRVRTE